MTTVQHRVTAEELLAMPHDEPCELIAGEIVKTTPAGSWHGNYAAQVAILVGSYVKQKQLGSVFIAEAGFIIARDPDTVRAPDFAFIRREREAEMSDGFFPGAPDLAVEVVSPNDRPRDVNDKAKAWLNAGALLVWVVWPDTRSVTVHRPGRPPQILHEQDTITGDDVLPGFQCRAGQFFGG